MLCDRLGDRLGVLLNPTRQLVDGTGAQLHDQLDEAGVLEVGDGLGSACLDVSIKQVPHTGFVLLEVDVFACTQLYLVPHRCVVGDLGLDRGGFGVAVPGGVHLVGEVAIGARQGGDGLV